jgi:3-methyladenine DNA glycosylase Mpg
MQRLDKNFFHRPCLTVAQALVGKILVHKTPAGELRLRISETEPTAAPMTPPATPTRARPGATKCSGHLRARSMFICATECTGL